MVMLSFLKKVTFAGAPVLAGVLAVLFSSGAGAGPLSFSAQGVGHWHAESLRLVAGGEIVKASKKNAEPLDADVMGKGAQDFVESMAQRGLDFLSDPDLSLSGKKKKFNALLQDSFDMDTIGRFSLGRYWRVSTPEQRKEYQALFRDMVIEIYSSRFSEYKGEKFDIQGYRVENEKDTTVSSSIVPNAGPGVQVDWRVRYKNGAYRIIDVVVEGVSMSVTQRSDFSAIIQRGGGSVDVLLDHLKDQQQKSL